MNKILDQEQKMRRNGLSTSTASRNSVSEVLSFTCCMYWSRASRCNGGRLLLLLVFVLPVSASTSYSRSPPPSTTTLYSTFAVSTRSNGPPNQDTLLRAHMQLTLDALRETLPADLAVHADPVRVLACSALRTNVSDTVSNKGWWWVIQNPWFGGCSTYITGKLSCGLHIYYDRCQQGQQSVCGGNDDGCLSSHLTRNRITCSMLGGSMHAWSHAWQQNRHEI